MNRANGWIRALGLMAMFAFAQSTWAATCTSKATGNWGTTGTWNCGHVPTTTDTVVLASPFTVTLDNNYTTASLTINAGAVLQDKGKNLTVTGNVINNGTFGVVGGGGKLIMNGAGTTISGTGTFADSRLYIDANVTLPATSTMNFTAGGQIRVGKNAAGIFTIAGAVTDVGATAGNRILRVYNASTVTINGSLNTPNSYAEIRAGGAVVNNGTATLQYLMGGKGKATSVWTNAASSTLNVSGAVCATAPCTLNASAAGNTVNYNGAAQSVYMPSGSTYANLTLSGSGATTVPTGLTVAGNFTMSGSATVAAPAALTVGGDFVIGAGNTFTPGTGTVTLNGAAVQTIGGGTIDLSFNNLTVSNTAGITLTRNVVVTGTLTGTVALTSTCPTDYTLTSNGGKAVAHSCTPATVASFDCIETGLTYTPNPVAPARNPLYTKLAGTAFSFNVVALKADGTLETNYAKSVTVELVDTSVATACTSYPALATSVSQTLALTAGKAATANMTVTKSYPSLACRVTDKTVTPNIVACSADKFSVRPVSLALTATSLNADATGASTTNTPAVKAGTNFTLTATASDDGYTGTPTFDNAQLAAHAGAVRNGTLAGVFNAAVASTPNTAAIPASGTFTYDEVGYFKLNDNGLLDATFTAIDSAAGDCTADFSTTLVGGKYGCKVGSALTAYFGRFIPDHFDTVVTDGCAGCGFTYSGQAFTVQVTAMNGLATPGKTSNYAKDVTLADANAAAAPVGVLAPVTIAASAFASGTATPKPNYTFTIAKTAPTVIKMRASDADVTTVGVNEGTTEIRSGRVKIANAHGSELLALPMTAAVQYYDGANWVVSAKDSTTSFNTNLASAGGHVNQAIVKGPLAGVSVQNANANPVANGVKTIILAKPGVAGSADISLSAPIYLLAGSNGAGVNPSVAGRATFSIYSGNNNIVYLREAY